MIKRFFVFFYIFFISAFVLFALDEVNEGTENASTYETIDPYIEMGYIPSNSIAQERDESEDGYYLDRISENKSFLLKDGFIEKTITTTYQGKYTIRTETDENGNSIAYQYDDRGNLVKYKDTDGSEENLVYDLTGHLISSNVIKDDELIRSRTYYRNPQDGSLIAIRDNDEFSFFSSLSNSSLFVVGNDNSFDTYETFFGSVTYKVDNNESTSAYSFKEDANGNVVISHDNKNTTYSKEGRVIEDNGIKYFYYDSGVLNYTEETKNDITTKEYYKDASVVMKEELDKNGNILKKYTYNPDTIVLELYEKNTPYAVITYQGDGVKVLDVRYL